MSRLWRWAPWLSGGLALAAYVASRARYPTEWDSVQLVMGMDRFDILQGSPHAPGYWLYVAAGRAVRATTGWGGATSMQVVAALAAAATVGLACAVGTRLGGRWLGVSAAVILATSPFLWFYGATVGTYSFDALASVVLLWLAWRARPRSWHGVAAAMTLGLATGFRQTSLIVLAPLAGVAVVRSTRGVRAVLAAGLAGAAGIACWLVPMAREQPGGFHVIRAFGNRTFMDTARRTSPFYGAPRAAVLNNIGQATGYTAMAVGLLVPLTLAALAVVAVRARRRRRGSPSPAPAGAEHPGPAPPRPRMALTAPVLLAVALVPSVAFVVLFHFGKAGYVLSFLPAAVLLLLWPAAKLPRRALVGASLVVVAVAGVDAQRFLQAPGVLPAQALDRGPWLTQSAYGAPYFETLDAIRQVDHETAAYRALAARFDARRDVLVYVWLDGAHRYRHAMYTLSQFTASMVKDGRQEDTGHHLTWVHTYSHQVGVPAGGHAVFVVDEPQNDLQLLSAEGHAREMHLPTGPRVWVVDPGSHLFGADVVSVPGLLAP